jgi:phosphopantetheine adenylyltransferase
LTGTELIVGVTDDNMTLDKHYPDRVECLTRRVENVIGFFNEINFSKYKIDLLTDAFGPSITDPLITALVLSEETVSGGDKSTHFRD